MNTNIPEHFVALVKQYANLTNYQEAQKVITEIVEALDVTLPFDQHKLFFAYTPTYIQPKKQLFYHRITPNKSKIFHYQSLIGRLMLQENLTDIKEVESRLQAFFVAMKIVSANNTYNNMISNLPLSIKKII